LLLPAAFITSLGNNIQLLGAALLLVRAHGSMLDVGWLFIAVAVPQAVLSPYFGRLADRFDRRRLWVGCDLLGAVAALALPIGLALGVSQQPLVYATNFPLAVVAAQFMPASAALIRERVPARQLRRFNAHYEIALQCGMLLSASVGGVALQYFGPQPLFTFNALTFVLSATLVFAVGPGRGIEQLPPATTAVAAGPASRSRRWLPCSGKASSSSRSSTLCSRCC
jgi:MFS family permease